MKKTLLIVNLLLAFVFLHAQESATKKRFLKKMDSCNIEFVPTDSFSLYKEIPIDTSLDVKYDYAIFDSINECEIRYKILPLNWAVHPQNDSSVKTVMVGQDMVYITTIPALGYDISQQENSVKLLRQFPAAAVKHDFNADRGNEFFLTLGPNSQFAKGHIGIYVISYYKKDKAMIFVFYLLKKMVPDSIFLPMYFSTYKIMQFKD